MKQKVCFRADAGAGIGYGHFIRSLALADMLKDDFDCVYYTADPSPYQMDEMEKVCPYVALKEATKFEDFLWLLMGNEIVVLDNYFFTTEYQRQIKAKGCRLVCIDDLHDKHYVADLIINQAINVTPEDYSCEAYTRFAFGLGYALLRKPFFDACKRMEKKHEKGKELNVVVAFGGSDFLDLTGKVIETITDIPLVKSITAIVGDSYTATRMVESDKVRLLKNQSAQEIADWFEQSDMAILPSSTMMNEALACGIKIIGGYYVQNQENDYYAFMKANMITGVGDFTEPEAMLRLRNVIDKQTGTDENVITSETPKRFVELFKTLY